jgi:hypothetical protein
MQHFMHLLNLSSPKNLRGVLPKWGGVLQRSNVEAPRPEFGALSPKFDVPSPEFGVLSSKFGALSPEYEALSSKFCALSSNV